MSVSNCRDFRRITSTSSIAASLPPMDPKYRATGNSMAVPVVRWIGERIRLVDNTITELTDAAE